MEPVRPNKWIEVEVPTSGGKSIFYYLPTWEPDPVEILYPVGDGVSGPFVVIADTPSDDPRPVPWIVDLGRIASALGAVDALSHESAREAARTGLKEAAAAIASAAQVNLRFPE